MLTEFGDSKSKTKMFLSETLRLVSIRPIPQPELMWKMPVVNRLRRSVIGFSFRASPCSVLGSVSATAHS